MWCAFCCTFIYVVMLFTIATSIVHTKLDYCNSLYYNLPKSETNRLQVIQNSLARALVKAPKFCHVTVVTPILKSLLWLKINERIEYKLLSLTYKTLATAQPSYLHSLISVHPPRATRSSSVVTYIFFSKNHQSLISLCITSSLE